MVEAAHRYNRIVQHGVQLRSSEAIKEAVQLMKTGVIGNVYMARGLVFRSRPSVGHKGVEPTPDYLNWDIWQGPAQARDFTRALVHYNWHWHWDYGNGDVGNQGIHETDLCMWGLGVGLPTHVTAMGGKFLWDDDKETPETLTSVYHYPEQKKIIQFEVRPWYTNTEGGIGVGNIFYGSEGYLQVNGYDSYEVFLGPKREPGPKKKAGGDHFANFIKAVESRNPADLDGPVETAHLASSLAHLGEYFVPAGKAVAVRSGNGALCGRRAGQSVSDASVSRALRSAGAGLVRPAARGTGYSSFAFSTSIATWRSCSFSLRISSLCRLRRSNNSF